VTRWLRENIARNEAQPIFADTNARNVTVKKGAKNLELLLLIKNTARSKQSSIGREFAQSGHPASRRKQ
jgi:hypothetical protein